MAGQPLRMPQCLQQTRNPLAHNRRETWRDKSDMGVCVVKLAGLEEHERKKEKTVVLTEFYESDI